MNIAFEIASQITRWILKFIEVMTLFLPYPLDVAVHSVTQPSKDSFEARIAQIDAAKASLMEGLRVVEELRVSADVSRREAELALHQLNQMRVDKASVEEEVAALKKVIETDVGAFRKVAGVPSQADINRERLIGFVSGVVASLVAAGLIWIGGVVWG